MAEGASGVFRCRASWQGRCDGLWEGRLLDVAQGGAGNAQAIQWALRNRSRAASGWDHAHAKLEVSGPDGGAVQVQTDVIDARLLTPEQRNAFKQALLAARAQGELGG